MAQHPRGEKHGMSVLNEDIVRRIREEHAKGEIGYARIALLVKAVFGVQISTAQVHRVVSRKCWAHVA